MNSENPCTHLARRVERFEPGAARCYRQNVQPTLEDLVRSALVHGPLCGRDEKLLVEVDRVLACNRGFLDRDSEELPGIVAERVCDRLIDSLEAQGRRRYPAAAFAVCETVAC